MGSDVDGFFTEDVRECSNGDDTSNESLGEQCRSGVIQPEPGGERAKIRSPGCAYEPVDQVISPLFAT